MIYKCLYYIILIFNIYLNSCYGISSKYNNNILRLREPNSKEFDGKNKRNMNKYINYTNPHDMNDINDTIIKNTTNKFIFNLNRLIINDIKNITKDDTNDDTDYDLSSSESLNIIDDNIREYKDDYIYKKHKSLQRTICDTDFSYKTYFIINRHKVIDIMNNWCYSKYNFVKLECIFKFLFIYFYINRNIKQVIGIFNIYNKCEILLFYEYRYINYCYSLYVVDKIMNPFYRDVYNNTNYTKYIDNINNIIINYDGCITNDNINNIINDNINNIINNNIKTFNYSINV